MVRDFHHVTAIVSAWHRRSGWWVVKSFKRGQHFHPEPPVSMQEHNLRSTLDRYTSIRFLWWRRSWAAGSIY